MSGPGGALGTAASAPGRVLMVRLSAIGDVVNTLPALSLLREALPEALIGFVVEDRASDLIVGHPLVDRVHVFPRQRWRAMLRRPRDWPRLAGEAGAFAAEIRSVGYEVALDFQGNLKGALHARLSGAPQRIGFARGFNYEKNHWFSTEQVRPPVDRPHRVDKFASLLAPLGIHATERRWVFPPSQESRARIVRFLEDRGIGRDDLVVIHPGTSGHGAEKRWPPDRFAALARRIAGELGRAVVVSWGPGEEGLARAVCEPAAQAHGCPGGTGVLAGPPGESLLDLLELIRGARAFVSADTGPMHIAAACGVPCVALFGPKAPAIYAPWGEGHRVIYRPDEPGEPGMERIGVDEVFAAVRDVLGAPSR